MQPALVDKFDYDQIWKENYGDMQDIGPVHRHMRRIVRNILGKLEYRSVLEVGCGQGHNLEILCRRGAINRFTGVDISSVALEQARSKLPGEYIQLDIQSESLPDTWDLVFSSLVMEHLPEDRKSLENMRRMTGKYLLLTTIAGDFERYRVWEEKMGHVRNYRVGELEEKVEQAGFEVVESIYWGFPFYSPIFRTLQGKSNAALGKVSLTARIISRLLYWFYLLNSRRRGDLVVLLAQVRH